MTCLNDVQIQAVVDEESTDEIRRHVAECERCRARVAERRRDMSRLTALSADLWTPPALAARVQQAVAAAPPVRGATALRSQLPSGRRFGWVSAVATAAGIGIVVLLVLPKFGAPTRLSAAQVIGRSLTQLTAGAGVERVEYDLVFASAPSRQLGLRWPDGVHRIHQLFDRANPGRYRLEQYDPDGTLGAAVTQDPGTHSRSELVAVDGRRFILRVTALKDPLLSIPELLQAQIEAALTMMQATADQSLTVVDGPNGRQYVIDIAAGHPLGDKVMLDLTSARAVISDGDFTIHEFHAAGVLLKQPFDISFKLIRQEKGVTVAPGDFEIDARPGDIVIEGAASGDVFHDDIDIVLRELAREKTR